MLPLPSIWQLPEQAYLLASFEQALQDGGLPIDSTTRSLWRKKYRLMEQATAYIGSLILTSLIED